MQATSRRVEAVVDDVWSVLTDGWLYPLFVVGASRMRTVDATWPAPGSRLHHSVGTWPLLIDDTTEVIACEPPYRLRLRAHAWPSGEAEVELLLEPDEGATRVTVREDVRRGPALLVPPPVRHRMLEWRNHETLRRLALIAENRDHG